MISSSVQQLIRETPLLPNPSNVQQLVRETPLNPNPSSVMQLLKGSPFSHIGIRGPQVEQFNLQLDRLINDVGNLVTTTIGVDLTTTGSTTIFTSTQKTFIMGVIIRITSADTVTSVPNASVGVSPATNNVFADEIMVSLDQVNDTFNFWNNLNTGTVVNNGEDLLLDINTTATATSLVATIYVVGVPLI